MTTIHFESGNFGTTIELDMLSTLPVNNIRKLLKLMFSDPGQNQKAILQVTDWLPRATINAKNNYGCAISLYKNGYRAVPKGYRSVGAIQQRKKNRQLAESVKSAKIAYMQTTKFQSIFDKTKEKYYA